MYQQFSFILTAVLFIYGAITLEVSATECKPLPMSLVIFIDWTHNMNPFDRKFAELIVEKTVSSLPDSSSVHIDAVGGNFLSEIVSIDSHFNQSTWMDTLHDCDLPRSDGISLSVIDKELNMLFMVNQFRQKAELVMLFASTSTTVDGISQLLYKKKAIVVLFGNHIPNLYGAIASDEKHVHLVESEGGVHLSNLTRTIRNQVFCASKFPCDRDQYRTKRGYRCMNCSNVCGNDAMNAKLSCDRRCPFIYRPPPTTVHYSDENRRDGAFDQKWLVLPIILIFSFIALLIACILGCMICWLKRKRRVSETTQDRYITIVFPNDKFPTVEEGEHNHEPDENLSSNPDSPSNETEDIDTGDDNRPLVDGQEELSIPRIEERSIVDDGRVSLLDDEEEDQVIDLGGGGRPRLTDNTESKGFVIDFQDEKELEANGNIFCAPVVKLHAENYITEGTDRL